MWNALKRPDLRPPSVEEVKKAAVAQYINIDQADAEKMADVLASRWDAYERLDELSEPRTGLDFRERDTGYKPDTNEDPLNAVVTRCRVEGRQEGLLNGKDIGLKDNISVARIEMTLGSRLFEGYVPSQDATIVTRLLEEGANITAKLNMDDMACSGTGGLSATGPVLNPHNHDYLSGGSSSGSASAVVAGEVDMAIGTDQAGSIRMPSSWCGAVGLKPTHGLVPYTGVAGIEHAIDHVGPITRTVEDCARLLEAISGYDPLDSRQRPIELPSYSQLVTQPMKDLTIGILQEAFEEEDLQADVEEAVRTSLDTFSRKGVEITTQSIPLHSDSQTIWAGIATEAISSILRDEGAGRYFKGFYDTEFSSWFSEARRDPEKEYMIKVKMLAILGQIMSDKYRNHYYSKAKNLSRKLATSYDEALNSVDVLAMPTTPTTALKVPAQIGSEEKLALALSSPNAITCPFNVTGHPAISIPCGMEKNDLPVGLMLVSSRFDEATLLRAAYMFEATIDPLNGS